MDTKLLERQREMDLAVIQSLKEAKSDLTKPHTLEHRFITYTRQNGVNLMSQARARGYQTSELLEGESEGTRYFYLDLIKPTIPTIENVSADTTAMHQLATEFGCDYDGWECAIVK